LLSLRFSPRTPPREGKDSTRRGVYSGPCDGREFPTRREKQLGRALTELTEKKGVEIHARFVPRLLREAAGRVVNRE
jgi:hypothetical protein